MVAIVLIAWTQAQPQGDAMPWWVWIFGVVILIFLLSGIWIRSQGKGVIKPEKDLVGAANEPKSQPRLRVAQAQQVAHPAKSEDLELIEGIGPRISGVLKAENIANFEQLAAATPQQIRDILTRNGLRAPVDPSTWPEQARLAAAGQWQALQKMQAELKGGRRTG